MADHSLDLDKDEDGWDYAACSCGWISPPCPDVETAADFYGEHRDQSSSYLSGNPHPTDSAPVGPAVVDES